MVKIEIDGKPYEVEQGSMIIEVTDQLGIPVPRFCYHKKLSIAANCRMCLVQVENAPKPLPACATPVSDGMKILTCSEKAKAAQQAVMEFLLINHPLDCPVCDQGGQCELQDIALEYGRSYSEYSEGKRSVADQDIGPLISTEMTRCIHCTRCVRFGTEIAGLRELGATGRGEHMQIGTFIEKSVDSEVSGNVIDLCPVGALTSKPFRFKARAWEMMAKPGISPHDCLGSNIFYHTMRGKVMRAAPKENEAINENWLSDRDRFSYEGLYTNRLTDPIVKKNGVWEKVEWQEALQLVVENLHNILEKQGASAIGALTSPNISLEEAYLLQKILRDKDIPNMDYRLKQVNFDHQAQQSAPHLGTTYSALEHADTVLLIGCDILNESPLLGIRLRKAAKTGAKILAVNPTAINANLGVCHTLVAAQGDLTTGLLEILKALIGLGKSTALQPVVEQHLAHIQPSAHAVAIARALDSGEKKHIILGAFASRSPNADWIYHLAQLIHKLTGATVGELSEGSNGAGCWLAGVLPHQGALGDSTVAQGKNAYQMLAQSLKAYILVHAEPDYDFMDNALAKQAFDQAQFVLALSPFDSASLKSYADIILPITPHTETKGTYINAQGDWQHAEAAVQPLGNSKPLWKVLRVLGNFWHVSNMHYDQLNEVTQEIKTQFTQTAQQTAKWELIALSNKQTFIQPDQLCRIAPTPIYAADPLVRNAASLQQTALAQTQKLWIHPATAERHQLSEEDWVLVEQNNQHSYPLQVVITEDVPLQTVVVPTGIDATKALGAGFSIINIQKDKGEK